VISNDSLPGYATGFRAESSETLAQRVDKPLFVGQADAACTQKELPRKRDRILNIARP
jgi:hypothetical protein